MKKLRKLTKYTLFVTGVVIASAFFMGAKEVKAEEIVDVQPGMVAVETQDGGTIVIPLEVQEKLLWENYLNNMKNTDLVALRAQSDDANWNAYLESLPGQVRSEVVKEFKAQGGQGSDEYLPKVQKVEEAVKEETDSSEDIADSAAGDTAAAESAEEVSESTEEASESTGAEDVNEKIKNLTKKLERLNKSLDAITSDTQFATGDNAELIEQAEKILEENPEIVDAINDVTTREELQKAEEVSEAVVQSLEGLSDEDIQKIKEIADASASILESTKKISAKFDKLKEMFAKISSMRY